MIIKKIILSSVTLIIIFLFAGNVLADANVPGINSQNNSAEQSVPSSNNQPIKIKHHHKIKPSTEVAPIQTMPAININVAATYPQYCSLWDYLSQTKISGDLRSYYFTRDYSNSRPDASAFSLGGMLNIQTAPLFGFLADAAIYTAQPLGLNSHDPLKVDTTLPGVPLTALGQTYLQYQYEQFLIRGGDQLIDTPWILPSDNRMIPVTYRAVYAQWVPVEDLTIIGLRVYDFKNHLEDLFTPTNLYNTNFPILNGVANPGALGVGANYYLSAMQLQAWYYQFYNYAKMFYGNAVFTLTNCSGFEPFIGGQVVRETGDGNNILLELNEGSPDSDLYGAQVGFNIPNGKLAFYYNNMLTNVGAFNHGDLASPYTFSYATDPLYTTSMIAGLIEKNAGDALKVAGTYYLFQQQLALLASYAKYYTEPLVHNTSETDFDVTYSFIGRLKGFSIRDRIGVLNGNPTYGRFVYNRVMLQYNF